MNPETDRHFARVQALRKLLDEEDLDALLITIAENRRYLSGFTGEDNGYDESAGALIVSRDRLALATDSRFDLQARQEAEHFKVHCYRKGLAQCLPNLVETIGIQRLGFEKARVSVKQMEDFEKEFQVTERRPEMIACEEMVESLRAVKDSREIEATRQALHIAEQAFAEITARLQPGQTEKEVAWMLESAARRMGAEGLSFPIICAAGPNSALPHAIAGDRPIQRSEPILFDWGVFLNGYCSDTSRTIVLGPPDDTFQKVYRTVRKAQQMAIAAIRPGIDGREVDRVARDHIENSGFKNAFGHGLGHGTGLAIHEAPRLSPLRESILQAGMIVTVEPGIYLPDWGGVRLENQVVVTPDGAEELNQLGFLSF